MATVRTVETFIWRTAAVLRIHRGWKPPPPPPPLPTPHPRPPSHTEGVALMLAPEAHAALIGWEPVNSHIITVKFTTKKKDIRLNIIQCYTFTNDAEEEKKDDFYQQLQAVLDRKGVKDSHANGRFQRQDQNGQHGLRGHDGDTWTGTDE